MNFNHPTTLRAQNRKEIYYNHDKPAFYKEKGSTLQDKVSHSHKYKRHTGKMMICDKKV